MPKLQDLREDFQTTTTEIKKLQDKVVARKNDKAYQGEILTAEERSHFDGLKTKRVSLSEQIKAEESKADLDELLGFEAEAEERSRRGANGKFNPNGDDKLPGHDRTYGDEFGRDRTAMRMHAEAEERRALLTSAWVKNSFGAELSEEERSACREAKFSPAAKSLAFQNWNAKDVKSLRKAAGTRAGEDRSRAAETAALHIEERALSGAAVRANTVPQVTVRAFELAIITYGGLVSQADVMVSDNGGKESFPGADDTANEGHQVDEVTAESTTSTNPTTSNLMLGIWEFSSKFIRIGNSVIRDAPYDIAAVIGQMVGERLVKAWNRKATTGAGTTTMRGILLDVTSGQVMADEAVFAWEELKRLMYSVDSAYRNGGAFMMHDSTLCEYMLLTDDHNRPLFTELQGDDPMRLFNRPVAINNFYPAPADFAADESPVITFGNHKAYKMKFASQTRIERATERFIEFNQTGFIGFRGADGALQTLGSQVKALTTPEAPEAPGG
jgi:HK97 family phage major capsid protein